MSAIRYHCNSEKCRSSEENSLGHFEGDSETRFCPRCGSEEIVREEKDRINFGHSYSCLECGGRSDFKDPPSELKCLFCGASDVVWIPQKFKTPSHVDATLRRIADRHKLSDLGRRGGTRPGESAVYRPSKPDVQPMGAPVNIGGFQTAIPADGSIRSSWTQSPSTEKIKVTSDTRGRKSSSIPTNVVAHHES